MNIIMKNIFFITDILPLAHGGRTNTLLQRARIFTDNNINVKVLTIDYNENYDLIYEDYHEKKKVNNNIEMCNIYDYYKWSSSSVKENYKEFVAKEVRKYNATLGNNQGNFGNIKSADVENNFYELKKHPRRNVTYYYDNGRPVYHISRHDKTNKVKDIEWYQPYDKRSVLKAYTNHHENIHKIRYFQQGADFVIADVFVDVELNPYLIKEYSYTDQETLKLDRIILQKQDGTSYVFNQERAFFRFWYEEMFNDGDVVINDVRLLDRPLLDTKKNIKKIFQLHNSHLENRSDENSRATGSFRTLFEHDMKDTDMIVSLTEGQKQNIIKKYPHLEGNVAVIPHSISTNEITTPVKDKQICIIARLIPQKKLSDAIEAFYQFNQQVAGYTLVIYGDGDEKEHLSKLIKEKDLESNVKLMGVTNVADEIFRESIFSIVSSSFEGFCLTVLESIVSGCPVISYDVMWGPSDIIDESSGRITKENTPEALCREMLEEIKNPRDRNNVRKRAEKFSKESFFEKWNDLIK